MRKYFTPLNIIFALEIIIVALISLGLIPREAVLILTGLMVFYMIFSSVEDGLILTIMSIPLFVVLPISDSFDSMANWRILIAVLFLCLFFKKGVSLSLVKEASGKWRLRENIKHGLLEYLTLAFLAIAALSILVAGYKILAIKKLLFLINIFLLFLIMGNLSRTPDSTKNREVILRVLRAGAVAGIIVIGVALVQFFTILFVPLYSFWQFWAKNVIAAFYGQNLANLLFLSNTWFSYFSNQPPILRLFSVFPDAHSFAMFCLFLVPIFLSLALFFKEEKKKKMFFWILAGLALLGTILSGSRGVWLSFIPVLLVCSYLLFKKIGQPLTKKVFISFLLFILLFLVSSFYPPLFYKMQSLSGARIDKEALSFFERAKSISDLSELSNKTRLQIWQVSLKSIAIHPILGVGLGNYVTVLGEDASAAKKGASAHNLYLDFASEIGVLGALFLVLIFLEILRTSWFVFKNSSEPHFKIFGLFFGLYFLWVMIYSLFDVVMLNDKVFLLFMVELGVLYSIKGLFKKEKASFEE